MVKLTLKIKLLPTANQADLLLETIRETNTVCNAIANVACEKRIFNNFKLHHEIYHPFKASSKLSSQCLIRAVAKVADINASKNIATLGAVVDRPEKSVMYSCSVHY